MATEKDRHNIKRLIDQGHITSFREIIDYYPITDLIEYLRTNHATLSKYFNNCTLIKFELAIKIANYFQVDEKKMVDLVYHQIVEDRKLKKKK